MIFVSCVWILAFFFCFAIGSLAVQSLYAVSGKTFARTPVDISDICSVGLVLIYVASLIWSLFLPVDLRFIIVLCVLSFVSVFTGRMFTRLKKSFQKRRRFQSMAFCFLAVLFLLLIAYLAAAPVNTYDTYLYHLNSVRWNSDFGLVKGLANLHSRFGFNSSFLVLASLFDVGPLRGLSSHFALSFLAAFTILRCLHFTFKYWGQNFAFLSLALLFSTLKMSMSDEISSLSTDNAMAYVCVLSVLEFFRQSFSLKFFARKSIIPGFLFVAFGALIFTSKISGSAFLIGVGFYLLYLLTSLRKTEGEERKSFLLALTILCTTCVLIVGAQVLRNIWISGWLFYPVLPFPFRLSWAVHWKKALYELKVIQAWGRIGSTQLDLKFSEWFPFWFEKRFVLENKMMLFGGFAFSIINAIKYFILKAKGQAAPFSVKTFIFYSTVLICFVSWFFNAPDQRFIALVFPIYFFVNLFDFTKLWFKNFWMKLAIFLIPMGIFYTLFVKTYHTNGGLLWSVASLRSAKVRVYPVQTNPQSIYNFYVPNETDQCGDSPLPCSPFVSDDLRLFEAGRLEKGFFTEKCNDEGYKDCPHVEL